MEESEKLSKAVELLIVAIQAGSEPLKKEAGEILAQKIEAIAQARVDTLINQRIEAYIQKVLFDDGK